MKTVKQLFWISFLIMSLLPIQASWAQGDGNPAAPPEEVSLPITSITYEADFSNEDDWPSGETGNQQMTYSLAGNGYQMTSLDPDGGIGAAPPIDLNIDDFYTEIQFTVDTCVNDTSALLFFTRMTPRPRDPVNANSYVFVLQCSGEYRAREIAAGGPGPVDTSGFTMSLEEDQSNVMGILISGTTAVWFMNGVQVDRFEIPATVQSSGTITPGAQTGFSYTVTDWKVWTLKTTGSNIAETDTAAGGDPLNEQGVGSIIYRPEFSPPTPLPLGLNHPVAAYVVGGGLELYNNDPVGIMPLTDLDTSSYYLELSFGIRDCSDTGAIGLAWQVTDDSYYAFAAQCDGQFSAYRVLSGEPDELMVTSSLPTAPRAVNGVMTLGIYVDGDTAWLYFDGQIVGTITDDALSGGHAGILLASAEDGTKTDIIAVDIVAYETR